MITETTGISLGLLAAFGGVATGSAELYHALHRAFSVTSPMSQPRAQHAAAAVAHASGRAVVISGGRGGVGASPIASIEVYDANQGVFGVAPGSKVRSTLISGFASA